MPADPRPSGLQSRSAARTAVVWDALRLVLDAQQAPASVVDIGGGTGGFAVRVAELGHRVVVIDPSPDALAILARRAEECGVAQLVTGRQGDLDSLAELAGADGTAPGHAGNRHTAPGHAGNRHTGDGHTGDGHTGTDGTGTGDSSGGGADVVVCHGVLEIVDDPVAALRSLAQALRPGGTLSLLVNQRHAAVVARAMAGHFQQARALLDPAGPTGRFTLEEVAGLLDGAGLDIATVQAVRVFVDLVPSSLVDLEPGSAQALVELERAVASRPEYLPLGTQLHVVAIRR